MNEPTQEFRKVVPYVVQSNLQSCTVQPANRIRQLQILVQPTVRRTFNRYGSLCHKKLNEQVLQR
jgi:hypothetical protein